MTYNLPSIIYFNPVTIYTYDDSGNPNLNWFSFIGDAANGLVFTMTPTCDSTVDVITIHVILDDRG